MISNLKINHTKRFTLRREYLGLHSGIFTNWYTFINLEAKCYFIKVKIDNTFCSLKQKLLYIKYVHFGAKRKYYTFEITVLNW